MAKIDYNRAIDGVRGEIDGFTYRQLKNGTNVVSAAPEFEPRTASAAQQATRDNFAAANRYAAEVLTDPLAASCYGRLADERKIPVRSLLVQDYLTPPVIEQNELGRYAGHCGDLIRIVARDDIEVVAVDVSIRDTLGVLREQGAARKIHD